MRVFCSDRWQFIEFRYFQHDEIIAVTRSSRRHCNAAESIGPSGHIHRTARPVHCYCTANSRVSGLKSTQLRNQIVDIINSETGACLYRHSICSRHFNAINAFDSHHHVNSAAFHSMCIEFNASGK